LSHAEFGFGFGHPPLKVGQIVTFSADVSGPYAKIAFWDGNVRLAEVGAAPWEAKVKIEHRGVRALHVVGIRADGAKAASLPAITIIE
jgi:hypothetical protein